VSSTNGSLLYNPNGLFYANSQLQSRPGGGLNFFSVDNDDSGPCSTLNVELLANGSVPQSSWSAQYCAQNGDGQEVASGSFYIMPLYPEGTTPASDEYNVLVFMDEFWGWSTDYIAVLEGATGKSLWSKQLMPNNEQDYQVTPYSLMDGFQLPDGISGAFQKQYLINEEWNSTQLFGWPANGSNPIFFGNLSSDLTNDAFGFGALPILQYDDNTGVVEAFDPFAKKVLWKQNYPNLQSGVTSPSMLLEGGKYITFAPYNEDTFFVSAATGEKIGQPMPLSNDPTFGPTVQGSNLIENGGTWFALYDIPSGKLVKNITVPADLSSLNQITLDAESNVMYGFNSTSNVLYGRKL
jgi:hypothetical protein